MKRKFTVFLGGMCMMALLGGCSYREVEDNIKADLAEQEQQEMGQDAAAGSGHTESGDGTLMIRAGEDGSLFTVDGSGSRVDFAIHDVEFYSSYSDFQAQTENRVGETYADIENCGFLTMEIDVTNIDYAGDSTDGAINMTEIGISKKQVDENAGWSGADAIYLDPHGTGETDYWHIVVKPGETKTCMMGFMIEDTDASRLDEYAIAPAGQINLGGYYDIPYEP